MSHAQYGPAIAHRRWKNAKFGPGRSIEMERGATKVVDMSGRKGKKELEKWVRTPPLTRLELVV
jgi:hypothetical protein